MIIVNQLQTPDGTQIRSHHVHDYVSHTDLNGKTYAVDGGLSYLRRSGDLSDCIDQTVTTDTHSYKDIRNIKFWGTYGKDGDQPMTRVSIAEMSDDHIKAVIQMKLKISNRSQPRPSIFPEMFNSTKSLPCNTVDVTMVDMLQVELKCRKLRAIYPAMFSDYSSIED